MTANQGVSCGAYKMAGVVESSEETMSRNESSGNVVIRKLRLLTLLLVLSFKVIYYAFHEGNRLLLEREAGFFSSFSCCY